MWLILTYCTFVISNVLTNTINKLLLVSASKSVSEKHKVKKCNLEVEYIVGLDYLWHKTSKKKTFCSRNLMGIFHYLKQLCWQNDLLRIIKRLLNNKSACYNCESAKCKNIIWAILCDVTFFPLTPTCKKMMSFTALPAPCPQSKMLIVILLLSH